MLPITKMPCKMAQVFSRKSFIVEGQVRQLAIPHMLCGGQSSSGTVFSSIIRFSPARVIPLAPSSSSS